MITLKVAFGNTILSGLTFGSLAEVNEFEAVISATALSNEIVHLFKRNPEQQAVSTTMTEDITTALDLSIIMQADDATDVVNIDGKYAGIKNILVELIP